MPKPIISVPIDDRAFNDFVERFERFEKKLDDLPESWKKVGAATLETNDAFAAGMGALIERMTEASGHAKNLADHLKDATDAQGQFSASTREGESGLKKMAKEAKELGDNVFGIGKFLLKMGAIGVGSITGGLFGIDKLGESAVANQRSARMLGLTTGQYRAYDTDLGRDVGDSTLQNVVGAQHDLRGQYWLQKTTGLSGKQLGSMDAGSIAAAVAMAENIYIKNHPNWNMQTIQAAGFTQLGESQSDLLLHGNTPLSEQQRALRQYQGDSGSLNYKGGAVDALYDFNNRLRIAGQHIETDFSDRLAELNKNGTLSKFITSLEKDAEILISGVFSDANLKSMQAGLTTFATYLGSQDFKNSAATFIKEFDRVAHALGWAADKADEIRHPKEGSTMDKVDRVADDVWDNMAHVGSVLWSPMHHLKKFMDESYHPGNNPGNLRSAAGVPSVDGFANFQSQQDGYAAMAALLGSYPEKHHADTLAKIINTYAPAKDHNDDAAYIANVSKWAGFKADQKLNLSNPVILSELMAAMVRQEHGWKVTPEQVREDIAQAHWKTPEGSSAEIKAMMIALAKQQSRPLNVNVKNTAGANVAVSVNAAVY